MSYSAVAADQSATGDTSSTENGRILQASMKGLQWAADNASDSSGITAASKAAAVVNLLASFGVSTKADLQRSGGSSLASKVMSALSVEDQTAVQALLS